MIQQITYEKIAQSAKHIFATEGYDGMNMRRLAEETGIVQSVIYHHYKSKDILIDNLFTRIGIELGERRHLLPAPTSAREMFRQRIQFQLENATEVLFVLKYFMHNRRNFHNTDGRGFVPDGAYKHIREVLLYGMKTKEFRDVEDIDEEAKVIAHAINGFVIEYYPDIPQGKELSDLVDSIYKFLIRSVERR
jgi:AcrR family transcriptional regulator